MIDERSLWETVESVLRTWVRPLTDAAAVGPRGIERLLANIGATEFSTIAVTAINQAGSVLATSLGQGPSLPKSSKDLQKTAEGLLVAIESLATNIGETLALPLFDFLTANALRERAPPLHAALAFIGVIDTSAGVTKLQWSRLEHVFAPSTLMKSLYGWGTPQFAADAFLQRTASVAAAFGAPVTIEFLDEAVGRIVDAGTIEPSEIVLALPLVTREKDSLGIGLAAVGGEGSGAEGGIAVFPAGLSDFVQGELSDAWTIGLESEGGGLEAFAVVIRPNEVRVENLANGDSSNPSLGVQLKRNPELPWNLDLGDGFKLASRSVELSLSARLFEPREFAVKLDVRKFEIAIAPSKDGFLSKILPPKGLRAKSDFTITWSQEEGLKFEGGLGFQITIPLHLELGPVELSNLGLNIQLSPSPVLVAEGRIDIKAELGPIKANVSGIGVRGKLDLIDPTKKASDTAAQFGPLTLAVDFLAPTGGGLAIDAGPLTGGGFIKHDQALGRYDGILDLRLLEIGITAIAMITTKMPDGSDGFALFINIGITFSPAINLPYNFTLMGVGGLCAVNRTTDVEALRSGVRNKTLGSILFPEDPILNANKIIADSERVFPVQSQRFLVAPMAKIGWGSDGLIEANIALLIELPEPVIIALLGQVYVRIPQAKEAKVKLNLDILGVLDISKKNLSFDASLYDSRILTCELYGDSALRLSWGSTPQFGLSNGGFHPKFTPPPNFPKLRRLTLDLRSGDTFKLTCTSYQGITSNSLQFGANLSIHAEAAGALVDGHMSFDTLFIFSPFEFDVSISGSVSVSFNGQHLASVRLSLDLSGPTPWHAKGTAYLSILCWEVSAQFDNTWGNPKTAVVAKVDPTNDFLEQLSNAGNWTAAFMPRRSSVETLKAFEPSVATDQTNGKVPDFLAHPAGGLEFRQRYLPLGEKLDKVANVDVKNNSKFDVTLSMVSQGPAASSAQPEVQAVEEHFARGQFKSLSKASQLSKPSFELFKAGVRALPQRARLDGDEVACDLEYESIVIDKDGKRADKRAPTPQLSDVQQSLSVGALQHHSVRYAGLGRFRTGAQSQVLVTGEAYTLVDSATLVPAPGFQSITATRTTQTRAEEVLEQATATGQVAPGAVLVVPTYEQVLR